MHYSLVTVVRDRINLAAVAREWRDLARHAVQPNPACEPEALLPALQQEGNGAGMRFVLVWIDDTARGSRQLCALFPFHGPVRYNSLPLVALRSYPFPRPGDCTPLLREDWTHACVEALLDWFRRDGEGAALLELRGLACDGAVYQAFAEVARRRNQVALATASSKGRRTLLLGDGPWGELALSGLPLLRWAKRGVASALCAAGAMDR